MACDSDVLGKLICQLRLAIGASLSEAGINEQKNIKICTKTRDLKCGDIVVHAGSTRLEEKQQHQLLESVVRDICRDDGTYRNVLKVIKDKYSLLTFYLHRANFSKAVFQEIHNSKSHYGYARVQEGKTYFIHSATRSCGSLTEPSLTDLRLRFVGSHVRRLLQAKGFSVHLKGGTYDLSELLNSTRAEDVQLREKRGVVADEKSADPEVNFPDVVKRLCVFEDRESNKSPSKESYSEEDKAEKREDIPSSEFVDSLTIDLQKIIEEKRLLYGKDGFNKNLHKVTVISESKATDLLQNVLKLNKDIQESGVKTGDNCLHIVPQHLAFRQQQAQLLSLALCDQDIQQTQLIVGPVSSAGKHTTTSGSDENAAQFYRTRYQQMKEASEMRYGAVSEGGGNSEGVRRLTAASIILDILGTTAHSPLYLDVGCHDRRAESHLGAFVLYNTARLATLMQHFAEGVSKGIYPDLPPVADVDFSLLREEEDWELVYLYIAAFPGLLQQSVEVVSPADRKLLAKIHTHKIANFLAPFCKCLSAHYSRYHILTAGERHLLPLMYARLYLMKSAHQVLLNCLDLIGVEPLAYL